VNGPAPLPTDGKPPLKSSRVSALMSVAMLGRGNSDNDAGSPSPTLLATVFCDDQPAP